MTSSYFTRLHFSVSSCSEIMQDQVGGSLTPMHRECSYGRRNCFPISMLHPWSTGPGGETRNQTYKSSKQLTGSSSSVDLYSPTSQPAHGLCRIVAPCHSTRHVTSNFLESLDCQSPSGSLIDIMQGQEPGGLLRRLRRPWVIFALYVGRLSLPAMVITLDLGNEPQAGW